MGRIFLGIIIGISFVILGFYRIRTYIAQGGIFLVLGSTTIIMTVFAARTLYDVFTPITSLFIMFLSTVFVALASVKYNNRALSILSLLLAGIAPLLTKSASSDYIGLFAYLFVIVLGSIWVIALTGQRILTTVSLIIVSVYSYMVFIFPSASSDMQVLLIFAYAFATLFFVTNTLGILKLKGKDIIHDLIAAAGNGLFLLAWILTAAHDEMRSLIISAWMIVFAVGAFIVFKVTQRLEYYFYLMSPKMEILYQKK